MAETTETPEKPSTRKRSERPVQRVLYTREEAAMALGVELSKFHELVNIGLLQKRSLAGSPRYLVREVEALAESLPVIEPGT